MKKVACEQARNSAEQVFFHYSEDRAEATLPSNALAVPLHPGPVANFEGPPLVGDELIVPLVYPRAA
jgi:hypothetical protein